MAFDAVGARAAGYSDEEIAGHLAQERNFDLNAARTAGYSSTEVIDHLSSAAPKATGVEAQTLAPEGNTLAPESQLPDQSAKYANKSMGETLYRAAATSGITFPEQLKNNLYMLQSSTLRNEELELQWRKQQNPAADWSRLDESLAKRKAMVQTDFAENRKALDVAKEYVQDVTPEYDSIAKDALISIAQNVPNMIAAGLTAPISVPAAVATGVGAGMIQQTSSTGLEAVDKGMTPAQAAGPAFVNGALEGAGEMVGLPKVFSAAKAGGFQKLVTALGYEGTQEGVTNFFQDVVSKMSYDPDKTWEEMGRGAVVAFLAGVGGGGVAHVTSQAVPAGAQFIADQIESPEARLARASIEGQGSRLDQLKAQKTALENSLTEYGKGFDLTFGDQDQNLSRIREVDDARNKVIAQNWDPKSFITHPNPEIVQEARNSQTKEMFIKNLDKLQQDYLARQNRGLPFDTKTDQPGGQSPLAFGEERGRENESDGSVSFNSWAARPDSAGKVFISDRLRNIVNSENLAKVQPDFAGAPQTLAAVTETLKSWMNTFMPGKSLFLGMTSPFSNANAGFAWIGENREHAYIEIAPRILQEAKGARLVEALAHEFGHGLVAEYYHSSPPQIKAALYRAWRDDVAKAWNDNETLGQFEARTAGVMHQLSGTASIKEQIESRSSLSDFTRYFTNFPEWAAHQTERALAGDFKGMQEPVKKYLSGQLAKLKKFWEKAVKPIEPGQTFREFMEYHVTDAAIRGGEKRLAETKVLLETLKSAQRSDMAMATLTIEQMRDLILPQDDGGPLDPPRPNGATNRVRSIWRNLFKHQPDDSDFLGDLDRFSRFKQLTASLLYIAKQNQHITDLYNPLGTADPQTGGVRHGYVDYVEMWHNARMKQMARSDDTLKLWRKLPKEDQGKLNRLMLDQTLEGKFYDLTDPAVLQKYELNDSVIGMFTRLKNDFIGVIDQLEAATLSEMNIRLQGNPTLPGQLTETMKRFDELRARPYFPLSRFGKHVVVVRAGDDTTIDGKAYKKGEVIYREHFDSATERASQMDAIRGAWRGHEVKQDMVAEAFAGYTTLPREVLEAVKDRLDLTAEQRQELDRYLLELAPARSFSKHLMQRRGIAGFSMDLQRAYAGYMVTAANYVGKIQYAQPMRESIQRLHATANAITGDSSTRRTIANYMGRHYSYVMAPDAEWASLRAAIAVSYLGFMVKSAFVNLFQVPMVTFPHLAAVHGEAKTIAELGKAYSDVRRMYEQLRPLDQTEQKVVEDWISGQPLSQEQEKFIEKWTGMKLSEHTALNTWLAERSALQEAKSQGFIDEALAMELVGMANGGWLSRLTSTTKLGYLTRSFSHVAMMPFEMAERMNRRVTFLAAYRLATKSGLGENRAFLQAKEAVRISQFEYARYNRPELLRGRKGILLMFMQYQLSMLYFLTGGDKGWWRALIGQLLVGGLVGLPFMRNILDLVETAAIKISPNEKLDIEKEAREFIRLISDSPDIFLHGISRYGFGLVPWADLSGSVSMGRIIPGTDVVKHLASGQDWDSAVADGVSEAGGATSSLIMRMLQAAGSNDPDVWRRVERGMPFTAGQQVMTALRWWNRGGETDAKGAEIHNFDPNEPYEAAEIIGKSLGFQPRSMVQAREELRLRQDFVNYYMIRRGLLLKALDFAKEQNDAADTREAIEQIHTYNREVPFKSMSIRAQDIQRSLKSREKTRAMQEATGATTKRGAGVTRELQE